MACSNCAKTSTTPNCSSGCASTLNADCVIYNGEPLPFEGTDVEDGDKRTLSSLLALIENCCGKESKLIKFHSDGETDDGLAYTVVSEDTQKVLLLTLTDEGIEGDIDIIITLPQTSAFINKEIIIKDICSYYAEATLDIRFNIQIQYEWGVTPATSNIFNTLCDSTHRTLKLRYVKTTDTSYQWIVCP